MVVFLAVCGVWVVLAGFGWALVAGATRGRDVWVVDAHREGLVCASCVVRVWAEEGAGL